MKPLLLSVIACAGLLVPLLGLCGPVNATYRAPIVHYNNMINAQHHSVRVYENMLYAQRHYNYMINAQRHH
jgi:hypothetical protein